MPYDSPMTAVRHQQMPDVIPLVENRSVDAVSGILALGQITLNSNNWAPGTLLFVNVNMAVSNPGVTGTVQLYNVTDGEVVTNGTRTCPGNTTMQEYAGPPLVVGVAVGDFKQANKLYELRLSATSGAPLPTDILTVGTAFLLAVYPGV